MKRNFASIEAASNYSTKEAAIAAGAKHYCTGVPCSNGHIAARSVTIGRCLECTRLRTKAHREANSEKVKAQWRAYWHRNSEERNAQKRIYQEQNREACLARTRDWRRRNLHKHAKIQSIRRARKHSATPKWVDVDRIETIYRLRASISSLAGQEYHVDHIVPLKNSRVCGLHVPWNLQIIPAEENLRKRNKFEQQT